jgi:hypothetical protein
MSQASMRIGVLHFSHETVTFLKNDTTLEDFIYPGSPTKGEPGSPAKGEALLKFDPKSYMGGFGGNSDASNWLASSRRYGQRPTWDPDGSRKTLMKPWSAR